MQTWTRSIVALLALALLVGSQVSAQDKAKDKDAKDKKEAKDKDTKKDAKKDDKASAGTVEISEGKDGKFRFAVRNAEGKYLGGSGPVGFATEKDAVAAIEDLKKVLATAKVITKKGDAKDKDGKDAKDKPKDKDK